MSDEEDARLAAELEAQGKAERGEQHWSAAMKGQGARIQSGDITSADLRQTMAKPNAATTLFYDGMAAASESEWRAWRDSQPHKRARIDRCK